MRWLLQYCTVSPFAQHIAISNNVKVWRRASFEQFYNSASIRSVLLQVRTHVFRYFWEPLRSKVLLRKILVLSAENGHFEVPVVALCYYKSDSNLTELHLEPFCFVWELRIHYCCESVCLFILQVT